MSLPSLKNVSQKLRSRLRSLVWAAYLFRDTLVVALEWPDEDISGREDHLAWADDLIDLWIKHLGLPLPTAETEASTDDGSSGATEQARGGTRANGTSKGKRKALRKGSKRGTVKRR